MKMNIEYGKWISSSNLIYGVKANEQGFKKLLEEKRKDSTDEEFHDGNGVSIFNLYDETGCDGWWIGNQDNPDGIVLGTVLRDNDGNELNVEDALDLELIETCKERFIFDYRPTLDRINHALGYENERMELYLVNQLYFVNKNTITELALRWPQSYSEYAKMVLEDVWDIREI